MYLRFVEKAVYSLYRLFYCYLAGMQSYFAILLFALTSFSGLAQACPCCTENHDQFDFWLGNWEVKDTNGIALGSNQISEAEQNCLIVEHWTGASGGTGTSYNYYDSSDSLWHQLWVSSNGFILNLKGSWQGESMQLRSELQKGKSVGDFYHQISWTPQKDGSIIQRWDYLGTKGEVLKTVFYGIYRKVNKD